MACGVDEKSVPVQTSSVATTPPNIIFILADDLGHGQIGVNGESRIKTPNIDKLATQGVRFTQAYAGGTVCSPSRVSLLTGRDSRLLHDNSNSIKIREQDVTLAHVLQRGGYDTALIGKYGIGHDLGVNDPLKMGFDEWYGFVTNVEAHRQYPQYLYRNNEKVQIEENANGARNAYAQELFTQEALSYIKKKRTQPFFLFMSYTTPHAELAAPDEYYNQYRDQFEEIPYLGMADGKEDTVYDRFYPEPVEQPNATMAAMVTALDAYVGNIMDGLKEAGLEENTIVIFTSDNGPHEESGADPAYFDASKPYRGVKRDLLDGGIHVPMIVRWPSTIEAGRVNDTPWAFWDLLPTFAELSGVSLDAVPGVQTNGVSVLELLKDQQAGLPERILYWEFARELGDAGAGGSPYQAARLGEWKAVRYGPAAPMELFNIVRDPAESKNLIASEVQLAARFKQLFDDQLAK
ncbi:MAG: arylsulfatase [Gammaproteobacteria bacterium]|nr:arylsulfatase [Gammaproteobacteria bacterium]